MKVNSCVIPIKSSFLWYNFVNQICLVETYCGYENLRRRQTRSSETTVCGPPVRFIYQAKHYRQPITSVINESWRFIANKV